MGFVLFIWFLPPPLLTLSHCWNELFAILTVNEAKFLYFPVKLWFFFFGKNLHIANWIPISLYVELNVGNLINIWATMHRDFRKKGLRDPSVIVAHWWRCKDLLNAKSNFLSSRPLGNCWCRRYCVPVWQMKQIEVTVELRWNLVCPNPKSELSTVFDCHSSNHPWWLYSSSNITEKMDFLDVVL